MMTMAFAVAMVACKAAVAPTVPPTPNKDLGDIVFTVGDGAKTISLTGTFNNATSPKYSATSSKTSVATATVSGTVLTVTPKDPGTTDVVVKVKADEGEASQTFKVTVNAPETPPANNPPTVRTISPVSLQVDGTKMIKLSEYFTDSDVLTYTTDSSNDDVATVSEPDADTSMITITAKAAGTAAITVTASDGVEGNTAARQTFDVTVTTATVDPIDTLNEPPEQTLIDDIGIDQLRRGKEPVNLDLSMYYDDPDGDNLTYTAKSSDNTVAAVTAPGDGSMITITGEGVGTARITVTASDRINDARRQTFTVTVGSQAPVATILPTHIPLGLAGSTQALDLSLYYNDPEGDNLTYTAESDNTAVATVAPVDGSMTTIMAVAAGMATITISAADRDNDPVERDLVVTVRVQHVDNEDPVISGGISPMALRVGDVRDDLDLSMYFVDPDEDPLTYNAESGNTDVATVTRDGSMITITAVAKGTATITVTASDGRGGSAEWRIPVTVTAENVVPEVDIPDQSLVMDFDMTEELDLSMYSDDSDGPNEDLVYNATSGNTDVATVTRDGSMITITAVAKGPATITVTATDADGGVGTGMFTVMVTNPAAPMLKKGFRAVIFEHDGEPQTFMLAEHFNRATMYAVDDEDGTVVMAEVNAEQTMLTLTRVGAGSTVVEVTPSNSGGAGTIQLINVTVEEAPAPAVNNPPTLTPGRTPRQVSLVLEDDPSEMLDVSRYFMDADADDTLTYTATSSTNNATATIPVGSSMLTIKAVAEGSATITVTASDDEASVDLDINVTVDPAPVTQPQNMAPHLKDGMMLGPFKGAVESFENIDLDMYFTDDGNDASITYRTEVTNEDPTGTGSQVIAVRGGDLVWAAAAAEGSAVLCDANATDGVGVNAIPDGNDVNDDMLGICYAVEGTAEITIVAIDGEGLESAPVVVNITVLAAGTIESPEVKDVETTATEDAYNPITDVDGDPVNTRLRIGQKPVKVIDGKAINLYFDDGDFEDDERDMLTFTVKHFAATTNVPLGTDGAVSANSFDFDTATKEITDPTKRQVMARLSKTTWDGDSRDKFTLTLTPVMAGMTVQRIALIATDQYGQSAARVFDVRVNHKPKAQGPQKTPKVLSDADTFHDLQVGDTAPTPLLLVNNADMDNPDGYFSDDDGIGDLLDAADKCRADLSIPLSDEEAPLSALTITRIADTSITLSATPHATVTGTMYADIKCSDGVEYSDSVRIRFTTRASTSGSRQ